MMLILVDSMERAYFFQRLVHEVRSEFDVIFVTGEPLAHLRLRRAGYRSVYLRHPLTGVSMKDEVVCGAQIEASIEVLNNRITLKDAYRDAGTAAGILRKIFSAGHISRCLVWNGQQILGRTVTALAAQAGVPVLYLEISNLPSKLFVDPEGVNALSSIRRDISSIDRYYAPPQEDHSAWMIEYERYKSAPLPQARVRWKWQFASLCNMVAKRATRGVIQSSLSLAPVRRRTASILAAGEHAEHDLAAMAYVFLPLQVSADTQIKLHSDVDNFQAIERAAKLAEECGLRLLVKLHPAERDASSIRRLVELQKRLSFEFTAAPTVTLIRNARRVVTINSTVGLEALLYGKPLTTLGRAFYERFDRASLLKYIHCFLFDGIDYFGKAPVPAAAARRVLGWTSQSGPSGKDR